MTDFSLGASSPLPSGWTYAIAGDFRRKRSAAFNPVHATDDEYELWSVPSHAFGTPEVLAPSDIGSAKQRVAPGDVLISRINPRLNRTWVVRSSPGLTQIASTEWVVFPKSPALDSRFLATLLSDLRLRDFLVANASGVGGSLTRVSPRLFDRVRIPVPPLNEQRRISASIGVLVKEIDQGTGSLRSTKQATRLYRQSLIKCAFEGRLTAGWRAKADELEPPDVSLSKLREEREARLQAEVDDWQRCVTEWRRAGEVGKAPRRPKQRPAVPAKHIASEATPACVAPWAFVRLGELNVLVSDGPFGSNLMTRDYTDTGVRVVRLENIGYGEFREDKRSFISHEKFESIKTHSIVPGTIIVSSFVTGGVRVCIVPESIPLAVNKADCLAVTIRGERTSGAFLAYYLQSRQVFAQLEGLVHGVGRPRINTAQLRELHVPVCAPAGQSEIVRILDARLEALEALDKEIDANLTRAEALRQSILTTAFNGELVPQDPNDEPAHALLARTRTGRERKSTAKPQRSARRRARAATRS